MQLIFTKMHGLGNDFVVIDNRSGRLQADAARMRFLADRRRGVGCDQVLLLEQAWDSNADFRYRIFNADGGEVEQCGNGARCIARFVHEAGFCERDELSFETVKGIIRTRREANGQVTVDMGGPCFEPAKIPFISEQSAPRYLLDLADGEVEVGVVSMGNPHAVLQVSDVDDAPVVTLGPAIQSLGCFPQGVNVGFMQILDPGAIRLRVFERGVGETAACGSGACAAVVVGRRQGLLESIVDVALSGGHLLIQWDGEQGPVLMTGAATRVYEGSMEI